MMNRRDLYRATPTVAQGLVFLVSSEGLFKFSRLLRQAKFTKDLF